MKYLYYKTSHQMKLIKSDRPLSIVRMQKLVGGKIKLIKLKNGNSLMINKEGHIKHLPLNPYFIQEDVELNLSRSKGKLCGNVIEGKEDDKGDFIGIL